MRLDGDDIKAIQALYGEKAEKPNPKVTVGAGGDDHELG